jgi:23S rRNA pseudouridine2605 synthase
VLHEGRKHQVKRMCAAVGHPVVRLHRSRYAGLTLEGLEPGAWRELEPSEVARLRSSRPARGPGRSGPAPARSRRAPG